MGIAQLAMALLTLAAAAIACLPLPSLFSVALLAFQLMVQLAVPLYVGIFSKLGDRSSALTAMGIGVACVCLLQAVRCRAGRASRRGSTTSSPGTIV